jgi:outer membrane lipopolysaccharide assembly protein LptE/RlpB
VYEGVIEALTVANLQHEVSMEVKHQLITNTIDVLTESARKDTPLRLCRSRKVQASMADIWKGDNKEYQKTAWRFMEQFADCK